MSDLGQNILSALIIGLIIAAIALVKNDRLKALIYSLPIPITATLIATGGEVNANHLIGLLLSNLFLWSVFLLNRRRVNIFLSDVIATLAYIGVGYVLIQNVSIPFYWGLLIYLVIWVLFLCLYRFRNVEAESSTASTIGAGGKFVIVSSFAFILLNLKNYLSSIIVTFPFSGVFAVVEGKNILEMLAVTFTRNSLAIAAMFAVLYILTDVPLGIRIAISWIVYLVVLKTVILLFPMVEVSSTEA